MTRYLLDSNALADYVDKRRGVDGRARIAKLAGGKIGTCVPALGEMYYGLEGSKSRDSNLKKLEIGLKKLALWPFDKKAAEKYGYLFAFLRRTGRPMQIIDIQIAAIALTLGRTTVVSSDTDFLAIPGLPVENWSS